MAIPLGSDSAKKNTPGRIGSQLNFRESPSLGIFTYHDTRAKPAGARQGSIDLFYSTSPIFGEHSIPGSPRLIEMPTIESDIGTKIPSLVS
jgi:hypothetical protein